MQNCNDDQMKRNLQRRMNQSSSIEWFDKSWFDHSESISSDRRFWKKILQRRMNQQASDEASNEGVGAMMQAKAGVVERVFGKRAWPDEPTSTQAELGSSDTTVLFFNHWSNNFLKLLGYLYPFSRPFEIAGI